MGRSVGVSGDAAAALRARFFYCGKNAMRTLYSTGRLTPGSVGSVTVVVTCRGLCHTGPSGSEACLSGAGGVGDFLTQDERVTWRHVVCSSVMKLSLNHVRMSL